MEPPCADLLDWNGPSVSVRFVREQFSQELVNPVCRGASVTIQPKAEGWEIRLSSSGETRSRAVAQLSHAVVWLESWLTPDLAPAPRDTATTIPTPLPLEEAARAEVVVPPEEWERPPHAEVPRERSTPSSFRFRLGANAQGGLDEVAAGWAGLDVSLGIRMTRAWWLAFHFSPMWDLSSQDRVIFPAMVQSGVALALSPNVVLRLGLSLGLITGEVNEPADEEDDFGLMLGGTAQLSIRVYGPLRWTVGVNAHYHFVASSLDDVMGRLPAFLAAATTGPELMIGE